MSNSKIRMIDTYLGFGVGIFNSNGELLDYEPNYGYMIDLDLNYSTCMNRFSNSYIMPICTNDSLQFKISFNGDDSIDAD